MQLGKIAKKSLPVIITITLVVIVYSRIDFNVWISELRSISFYWFFALLLVGLLQSIVSTIGWHISLKTLNISVNFFKLLHYYLMGGFISYLLPGTVGGDAAKLILVGKDEKKYKEAFVSLVMQRIIGLFVAITFFFIPVVLTTTLIDSVEVKALILFLSFFLAGLIILLIFSEKVSAFFYQFIELFRIKKFTKFIGDILVIFSRYRKFSSRLFLMSVTSLLFQIISLFFRYIILIALNIQIGFFDFISIVIIVTVIVQIPISMAGIGVREGSYVYFYSKLGITTEKAVAFSLLEYIPGLVLNSFAVLIYLGHKMLRRDIVKIEKVDQ